MPTQAKAERCPYPVQNQSPPTDLELGFHGFLKGFRQPLFFVFQKASLVPLSRKRRKVGMVFGLGLIAMLGAWFSTPLGSTKGLKSNQSFEGLIRELKKREGSIQFLKIQANCKKTYGWDGQTKRRGESHILCKRQIFPNGLIWIEENPDIAPYEKPGIFIVTRTQASFDGDYTYLNLLDQGVEGKEIYHLQNGEIRKGRTFFFQGTMWDYGWDSTVFGFGEGKGLVLSEILGMVPRLQRSFKDEGEEVFVTWKNGRSTRSWCFSKAWGYALKSYENRVGGVLERKDECSNFFWVSKAKGVAFPREIRKRFFKGNLHTFDECRVHIVGVEDWTERPLEELQAAVSIPFVKGQMVHDYVRNRSFVVGRSSIYATLFEEQGHRVRALLAQGPRRPKIWGRFFGIDFFSFPFFLVFFLPFVWFFGKGKVPKKKRSKRRRRTKGS